MMTKKTKKIDVQGSEITILANEEQDYISLTDMVRDIENGSALIEKWLRNKNSIEFLGIWEEIYNPDFNSLEFEGIKNQAGLNRFILSVGLTKQMQKGLLLRRDVMVAHMPTKISLLSLHHGYPLDLSSISSKSFSV